MNKFIVMGRFTADPEIRHSQGENPIPIANFSLAVDKRRGSKDGEKTDFFNCTAFGKTAEFIEKHMKKGVKVVTTGRMENNNYPGKDGQMVRTFKYYIDEIEFAESKKAAELDPENPVEGDGKTESDKEKN